MNIETIKTFQTLKTPFYYYDTTLLQATLQAASQAANEHGFNLHYAIKANANPHILDIIQSHGIGADCVSGNEVAQAVASGFPSEQIVYAGVGKSDEEIRLALEKEIFCFNCESLPEIEVINILAGEMGEKAPVALRVNPNVDAHTHHYITTGIEEQVRVLPLRPRPRHHGLPGNGKHQSHRPAFSHRFTDHRPHGIPGTLPEGERNTISIERTGNHSSPREFRWRTGHQLRLSHVRLDSRLCFLFPDFCRFFRSPAGPATSFRTRAVSCRTMRFPHLSRPIREGRET